MKTQGEIIQIENRRTYLPGLIYIGRMGRDSNSKGMFQNKPPKKSQAPIDMYRKRLG